MHRRPLLDLLNRHPTVDAQEEQSLRQIEAFVREHADCFSRSLVAGHITGSAWLLDEYGDRVLLTHHRKLGLWLQLGGHADGNPDVLDVALREAREESGLQNVVPLLNDIFDVDVHAIPARENEPAHFHYDIRFLLRAVGSDAFRVSDESHALRWCTKDEVPRLSVDASVLRMHRKWLALWPTARASY